MTVTFAGHGDFHYKEDIKTALYDILENLILEGVDTFYLGGYGNFDILCAETVKKLKEIYPHIKSILVIPYLDKKYNLDLYDETVYPPLENTPLRFAISKRNEWMAENSDIVVAYVNHTWGGAFKMLSYAKRKKRKIINISL